MAKQTEALMFAEFLKILEHGKICSNTSHLVFVDCVDLATAHVLLKQKRGLGVGGYVSLCSLCTLQSFLLIALSTVPSSSYSLSVLQNAVSTSKRLIVINPVSSKSS